ncbi:MAG: ABC transporter permease [Gracilibacteraceae bacterium]|jgi:hypothetical protein|nr:ABC transporter permease [Gracilibacteraceae bacterium]
METGVKIWRVFRADALLLGPRLPLWLGGLLLCAACFFFSLPAELTRSREMPKISIALVNQDANDMTAVLTGLIADLDMVEKLYVVEAGEADKLLESGAAAVSVVLPAGMIDALVYGGRAEITLKALDPFIGALSLNVAGEYVKTMNRLQQTALAFHDSVRPLYADPQEFYQAERAFDLSLLQEALLRARHVSALPAVSPYHLQLLALLFFALAAGTAIPLSALSARQLAAGYFRRLAIYRVRPAHICAARALTALGCALLFALAALPLPGVWDIPCSGWRLVLSVCFLTVVTHCFCMFFAAFRVDEAPAGTAAARTALGALALLLFMLFAGGGFYPAYLTDAGFQTCNPAWLAHLLAEWTLGGAAPSPLRLLWFAAPAAVCGLLPLAGWRQA